MTDPDEMRIILIHGFGCSSADWLGQSEYLARLADVVALDLPGQDEARRTAGSLIGKMAAAVNEVRRTASPARTVLVGHSLGCRVAVEAAQRVPEAVAGLVLIEGSLRAFGDPDEAARRYRCHTDEENKALMQHDFGGMFSAATPAAFRRHVLQRLDAMDSGYAARLMEDMTRWDAADAASALHAVRTPMLVIQSTYKELGVERRSIKVGEMPPWLRLVDEQAAERAKIVRLSDLGHFPQVEAPAIINTLIGAFLKRLQ